MLLQQTIRLAPLPTYDVVIPCHDRAHARVVAVVLPRNAGASQARNTGAGLGRFEWMAFLDSDDVWLPGAAGRSPGR